MISYAHIPDDDNIEGMFERKMVRRYYKEEGHKRELEDFLDECDFNGIQCEAKHLGMDYEIEGKYLKAFIKDLVRLKNLRFEFSKCFTDLEIVGFLNRLIIYGVHIGKPIIYEYIM